MQSNGPEPTEENGTERGAPADAAPVSAEDPRDARIAELEAVLAAFEARAAESETKQRDTEGRLRAVSKAYQDQRNEMTAFRERVEANDKRKLEMKEFEVVRTFLDPVENLNRSIEADVGDVQGWLSGVRMIHQQFMDALRRLGLEEVPGQGAPFDPNVHEALATTPVDDPEQDDKVQVVYEHGWTVRGKVLKPAQVAVGRHAAEPASEA